MRPLTFLKIGCGLIGICWLTAANASDQTLPNARDVVSAMLERSAMVAGDEKSQPWAYDKVSVTDQLGDDGNVTSTVEKIHRVRVYRGVPFSRLVKIQGQPLSPAELRKEDKREAEFRKRISGRDPGQVASKKEPLIMKDLVDRYRFEVRKRELIDGRPTLQVVFAIDPEKLVEKSLQDRILNRLAGTVWVDEATSEVARLDVYLTRSFSLGILGILGSLSECRFNLTRKPMPDGTWLPHLQETQITARKLSTSVHFRVKERCSNFQPEPAP
jgi:hypothetical protein